MHRLNFHFQSNINVETKFMNVDDQRCLNFDSTLMCLLGIIAGSGVMTIFVCKGLARNPEIENTHV